MPDRPLWVTHLEAARRLGCSPSYVQTALRRGELERRPPPRDRSTPSISVESVERLRLEREQLTAEKAAADERRLVAGTPPPDGQDWLNARETADLLGLSRKWVHAWARAERIPSTMHGGRVWVRREDAERLRAAREFAALQRTVGDQVQDGPA